LEDAVKYYKEDAYHGLRVLEPFLGACKEFTVIEGNHDYRFKHYLNRYPHLQDLLSPPELYLQDYGVHWCPYWSNKSLSVKYGKAEFVHGQYTNKYHAEKHARLYLGSNVFYGHVHDNQSYSPVIRQHDHVPTSESLGCLCRLDQPWLQGAANNWQQMFAGFYVMGDGNFTYYPIKIFDNRFVGPDGKEYRGGKK
jgi:predicted phosphodiesterase